LVCSPKVSKRPSQDTHTLCTLYLLQPCLLMPWRANHS